MARHKLKPHTEQCGLACKLKFTSNLDLAHHYLVGHHSPDLVKGDGFFYCSKCFEVFKSSQKHQWQTHEKHGKHLICPKDKRAFYAAKQSAYNHHISQEHSLKCKLCELSFLPSERLFFEKHEKEAHLVKSEEAADVKEDDRLVDEFEVEEDEEEQLLATRLKVQEAAQAESERTPTVQAAPIVEAFEVTSIYKAEVKSETRTEALVEDEAELVVDANQDGGGAEADVVMEAVKTEVEGKELLEVEDELIERGTELAAVEEEQESEVELVMEGVCPDENHLEKKLVVFETFAKEVEAVDTESEVEDDAVEVTGDLDYDFVEQGQDASETEFASSGAIPVSEAGINVVEAEVPEVELDAGKEEQVVVSDPVGGLVGQVYKDEEEVILLPDEIHDPTEEVESPVDGGTLRIEQDFDGRITEGEDKAMEDLEEAGGNETSQEELDIVLEQPTVETSYEAGGAVSHGDGVAALEEPALQDQHDAEQDEVQLVDQGHNVHLVEEDHQVQLVDQDHEVQLVGEDLVQPAELEQVVPEVQMAAQVEVAEQEKEQIEVASQEQVGVAKQEHEHEVAEQEQEQEQLELQIAEQEEAFSPDLVDRESSPPVTVVSDSEPEVSFLFHFFRIWF